MGKIFISIFFFQFILNHRIINFQNISNPQSINNSTHSWKSSRNTGVAWSLRMLPGIENMGLGTKDSNRTLSHRAKTLFHGSKGEKDFTFKHLKSGFCPATSELHLSTTIMSYMVCALLVLHWWPQVWFVIVLTSFFIQNYVIN